MSAENRPRPYTKRKRAELEEETRLRITRSAMELHGTLGPARTSISAIAERAGVRRSTVYRHFADESAIIAACSAHWAALNPPPDPTPWAAIEDPDARLGTALGELYAFYRRTEQMMANVLRDEPLVPALEASLGGFWGFLDAVADLLATGRPADRLTRAALGHAVAFGTWQSLTRRHGLPDDDAVALMRDFVGRSG